MDHASVQQRFTAALDALVDQIRSDKSILAAILCGSLSHDVVWEKSDIDLVLVTIDDKRVAASDVAVYADGVNVHAWSAAARRIPEAGRRHSAQLVHPLPGGEGATAVHARPDDRRSVRAAARTSARATPEVQLLRAGTEVLPCLYKAHKWFVTRGDLDYTALWILYAATPIAAIEIIARRRLADREVIPQALAMNPALFQVDLHRPAQCAKTRSAVQRHSMRSTPTWPSGAALFAPILDHLREVGEARACRDIEDHFPRHHNVDGVTIACEYLADAE